MSFDIGAIFFLSNFIERVSLLQTKLSGGVFITVIVKKSPTYARLIKKYLENSFV